MLVPAVCRARTHSHSELNCRARHWDDSPVAALWPREDLIALAHKDPPAGAEAGLKQDTGNLLGDMGGRKGGSPGVCLKA